MICDFRKSNMHTYDCCRPGKRPTGLKGWLAAAVTALLASTAVMAQDNDDNRSNIFAVRLGGGSSDNIYRDPTAEKSGSYSAVGMNMDFLHETRRVDARLFGDLELRSYSESGIDNERLGSIDASAEIFAVPEKFSWFFGDTSGNGRTNPFRPDGPGNREKIDVYSTGPRLDLPIGARTSFRGSAIVGQRRFGDSNRLDSDTTTSDIGFFRGLSSTAEIGFGASQRKVEYDVSALDNDITSAYVSYDRQLASGRASIKLGTSQLEFATIDDTTALIELFWARDVGARSQLSVSLGNDYNDVADAFRFGADLRDLEVDPLDNGLLLTADVYESTAGTLTYQINGDRTRVNVAGTFFENDYSTNDIYDNDGHQLRVSVQRDLSQEMAVGALLVQIQRDFKEPVQNNKDGRLEIYLRRQFGRRFSMEINLQRNSRSGGVNVDYDENVAEIFFQYDLSTSPAAVAN